jgi:hypothetical protein
MAVMNLLKSTFEGSLGRVTGANWKGKPVVKARIFSKAPPSNAQTQSVRAFEALNRISAVIAKQGFSYMGLSQKTMNPHNAVAKFLKPIIKNHVFDIANAIEIIPKDQSQLILGFTHNKTAETATLNIGLGPSFVPLTGTKTFINVFNQYGVSFFSDFIDTSDYLKSFFMPYSPEFEYNAMIFMSEPAYKGVFLHGLDFKKGAGMQYSLDEQLTGDLWLDGRPVYQRTFNCGTSAWSTTDKIIAPSGEATQVLSAELLRTVSNDNRGNLVVSVAISSSNFVASSLTTYGALQNGYYYLTVRYVK